MANQLTSHESQVDNYLEPNSDRERFCIDKAKQAINNAFKVKEYQNEVQKRQDRLKGKLTHQSFNLLTKCFSSNIAIYPSTGRVQKAELRACP